MVHVMLLMRENRYSPEANHPFRKHITGQQKKTQSLRRIEPLIELPGRAVLRQWTAPLRRPRGESRDCIGHYGSKTATIAASLHGLKAVSRHSTIHPHDSRP